MIRFIISTINKFDFYIHFDDFKEHIENNLKQTNKILIAGIGSSRLLENLFSLGIHNITGVDFSYNLIKYLEKNCKFVKNIKFLCQDLRTLNLPNESFDVVIDKATFDAMLVKFYIIN